MDPLTRTLKRVFLVVLAACVAIFIWGTVKTYQGAPPIPDKVVTASGQVLFTDQDIVDGKAGFQEADLMDYGTVYGNGSYFGEDYTALLLHQLATEMMDRYAEAQYQKPWSQLDKGQQTDIQDRVTAELQHPNLKDGVLTVSDTEAAAMRDVLQQTQQDLLKTDPATGYSAPSALDGARAAKVADFLMYTAWTAVAHRPGLDYSYTNNWPYDPLVGNTPTAATFTWTWASIGFLLAGIGVTVWFYFAKVADPLDEFGEMAIRGFPELTVSQRKTGKFFVTVAILFLIQIGAGGIMAHYYSDRASFFGINLLNILPFNVLKAVHIQTSIFWIAIAWIGAGVFLAPFISGKEPRHQGKLVDILFGAVWLVGLATLFGLYAGIKGWLPGNSWFWFGNQGLTYLQLGRFDQLALFAGLILWVWILGRALWPALKRQRGLGSLEHLLLYSGISIAAMYVFGMFPVTWIMNSFTLTDFWRWWVVHLWVEGTFEFFTVIAGAYLLVALGLVSRKTAERATWFELILVFMGGIVGTGHHMYWVGEPWIWLSLGSMFSFIEVMPLLLMIVEAIDNRRRIQAARDFKHRVALTYIMGAGVWNFFGAGVLGGLINAPLINYYEHGTFLTLAHAHTAMFGAFGLLGLGLVYFAVRYFVGDAHWSDRPPLVAFWLYNIGMVLWCLLNFWPIGFEQLAAVYTHDYVFARSMAFYNTTTLWQWLRFPGDIFFTAGALLMSFDIVLKLRTARRARQRVPRGKNVAA
ncbi:nitric-oxide reductase large subunit [Alicyclobacillus macrosporangiidus]|uniref:Nitric oxide reductase subunit B n=1 Tax=Alicyclobacillus macrosporangiidus TaxID=392015 RepID=A0A1I7F5T6_9BACL|nr:cbb3-type cytochrome c oxidase subunit I [Alicyclobacillus macrosporangiidus]SFU31496.1 nitric oxide reductase subunit B [Alicyclobacillus macrosporangiidus]